MSASRNIQAATLPEPNHRAVSLALSRPPRPPSRVSFCGIVQTALSQYNRLRRLFISHHWPNSHLRELSEIKQLAAQPSDINEHLETMFVESLLLRPRLIVELGVRGGVSTFVFERAARLVDASLVSVDVEDCSTASAYPKWHFFRGDDVHFASQFVEFCKTRGIVPSIDLLFIDTSHYYDHTTQEIRAWFPLLASRVKVIFHDTNLRYVGPRRDGCFELGWNNQRGVVRAIEESLNIKIDENREDLQHSRGWLIRHTQFCNGLTILDRWNGNAAVADAA